MAPMSCKLVFAAATFTLYIIVAAGVSCPTSEGCVCGGTVALELHCNIEGYPVKIGLLPDTYLIIRCANAPSINYDKLPKLSANSINSFKSVTFKDCPLPASSFKDVLNNIGVTRTLSLIFQNAKNLSTILDKKHFEGLQDLTKLLLSVNSVTHLPDNLFTDMRNLTWLNIRSNGISLSEKLFKPLERLETLEISHNHMTNISANLFSHLTFLRKLSLWQSNITRFSKDLFTGVDVLEELDLSSNGLNELPQSIFNPLKKLKKLTLFSNKFSTLPSNLFKNNKYLDTVIIFNNDVKLKELPKGFFSKLTNLKEVYIQRCELENIPQDVFSDSPRITNLSLAYNEIQVLPEAIFNDQINLLELDLSHNKLTKLEPKLFSSLVKLESLKLCHNSLLEISGNTFSSLLSLFYLDIEGNNIKTITSYLFSNNKQRMSINMAYNRLDFKNKELVNNSWVDKEISPLAFTYNLKLLNLSHNEFKINFDDWWANGHEKLDISYNNISQLWSPNMAQNSMKRIKIRDSHQKPLKEIWIKGNPLRCNCQTFIFLQQLQNANTKVNDIDLLSCSFIQRSFCHDSDVSYILLIPFILTLNILGTVATLAYRKRIYNFVKSILGFQHNSLQDNNEVVVLYSSSDEEFILQELLPGLKRNTNLQIHLRDVHNDKNKNGIAKYVKSTFKKSEVTIVVFSPNYLTSVYRDVNIKKIKGKMLKTNNTIYLFVDIGPENSIYAFLKEQRDLRTTVVWNDLKFWSHLVQNLRKISAKNKTIQSQQNVAQYNKSKASKINKYLTSFKTVSNGPKLTEVFADGFEDHSLV